MLLSQDEPLAPADALQGPLWRLTIVRVPRAHLQRPLIEVHSMEQLGKLFAFIGVLLVVLGGLFYLSPSIPLLGKLPGDIYIERPSLRIYFPITTCLVLSALVSRIFYLVLRFR